MRSVLALCVLLFGARQPSLAETYMILPFFNTTKNANLDWIGESLAESIREALAAEGIIALDRDDRQEAYRRLSIRPNAQITRASMIKLAEAVDTEKIITGSYELLPPEPNSKTRGTLRITAQIMDIRKMSRGPEYLEIGALEDLARIQSHLAWQTLQFAALTTAPSEEEFKRRQPLVRVEAIENYVRGLLAANEDSKLRFFSQAVKLEPKYSQANYELGRLQWTRKNYKPAADALAVVGKSDPHYYEANFYRGLSQFRLGDYAAAQQSFQIVADMFPLNEVQNNLGAAQSRRNQPGALDTLAKALEGDQADPDYHFNVGYALYKAGKLEAAAERFRAVLDRSPEDAEAMTMLGRSLRKTTTRGEARLEGMERLKETYEETAYRQLKAVLEPKR